MTDPDRPELDDDLEADINAALAMLRPPAGPGEGPTVTLSVYGEDAIREAIATLRAEYARDATPDGVSDAVRIDDLRLALAGLLSALGVLPAVYRRD